MKSFAFRIATLGMGLILYSELAYSIGIINGSSMIPTFNSPTENITKDIVLIDKHSLDYSHGDIVFFKHPFKPHQLLVKRIVGVYGDYVLKTIPKHDNHPKFITLNPMDKTSPIPDDAWIKIPKGHVWVESDSKDAIGGDSRKFGPIPAGLITAKVIKIIYPFEKWNQSLGSKSRAQMEHRLLTKDEINYRIYEF